MSQSSPLITSFKGPTSMCNLMIRYVIRDVLTYESEGAQLNP